MCRFQVTPQENMGNVYGNFIANGAIVGPECNLRLRNVLFDYLIGIVGGRCPSG